MIQQNKGCVLYLPATIFWIFNLAHGFFTYWAIVAGGEMEMASLFPMFFIEIPSAIVLVITLIFLIAMRGEKFIRTVTLIPIILYLLQVSVFWIKLYGIF